MQRALWLFDRNELVVNAGLSYPDLVEILARGVVCDGLSVVSAHGHRCSTYGENGPVQRRCQRDDRSCSRKVLRVIGVCDRHHRSLLLKLLSCLGVYFGHVVLLVSNDGLVVLNWITMRFIVH